MSKTEGIYKGRLQVDDGDLQAGEGEHQGKSVAFHEGSFVFVNDGEENHNERHARAIAVITGSVEEDPHHTGPTEDDAHFMPGAPNNTRIRFDRDSVAAKVTGHTEAYKGGDNA